MEPNVLKKKWNVLFNELKERWPDLTQPDIDYIEGDKQKLIETVQRRRHFSAAEAARDVEQFLNTLDARQRVA
jgi:uncharacterized protein YjbJ (UPF0337 family)